MYWRFSATLVEFSSIFADDRKYGNGNDDRSRGRDEQRRSQDRNPSEHSEGLKEEKGTGLPHFSL